VATYRVLKGIDYPPSRRAEAGDVVTDLPERSAKWLLAQGVVETVAVSKQAKTKPVVDEPEQDDEPVYGEEDEG
jgi:hypothetical protein